jgi:cobalt transporter subunit CbtB
MSPFDCGDSMQRPISSTSGEAAGDLASRIVAATAAMLLGTFLLIGVGFAHSDVLHNAAHDSRHTFSFPCH